MELSFVKMHGLGNDFVLIEDLSGELDLSPDAVAWLCDRNFGIGGDGVILVRPASVPEADYFMLYYNSDGTVAEMCGNGVRCFAKYLVDHRIVGADCDDIRVETLGGIKPIAVTRESDGRMAMATVDMGEPILTPSDVPTTLSSDDDSPVIAGLLETTLGLFSVTCVSMGNPHCVMWVDDVQDAPVGEVGPEVETHCAFPARTNVEFAEVIASDYVRLRVWERGVGETLACGTGACATTVAGVLTGRTDREVTIELPGGELAINWAENNHVYMTGSAEEVFAGILTIPEDDSDEDSIV
ncbi:MAG: diaminopimelate epimerase [Coriobacteriia bacterium]|nr:diaminopimelate epimerase [Coriobacteriia bacterium]